MNDHENENFGQKEKTKTLEDPIYFNKENEEF